MSFWILLWLFLSLTLLYFFVWTLLILYRQKKAWSTFAKKNGLTYIAGKLSDPPEMQGDIQGYEFSFFPGQYDAGDVRKNRQFTAIEMTLKGTMPFEGFIASGLLVDVAKEAGLPETYKPDHDKWSDDWVIVTDNRPAIQKYLAGKRIEAIIKWMRKKNLWFVLGFRNDVFLLRIDTPLPLADTKKLNALVKMMLSSAPIFEITNVEASMLRSAASQTRSAAPQIAAPAEPTEPNAAEQGANIQLEGDNDDS